MVQALSQAQIDQLAAEGRAELMRERAEAPAPINVENALALFGPQQMQFRGRVYEVPPIPFEAGLQALAAQGTLERLRGQPATQENVRTMRDALNVAADLFPKLARRRGLLRWLPLRRPQMTEGEALSALGFFLGCRVLGLAKQSMEASPARQPIT